jgi:hypothetical protein
MEGLKFPEQAPEVVEDAAQFVGQRGEFGFAQRQTGKAGDVLDVGTSDSI